jgi:hypothetical protein
MKLSGIFTALDTAWHANRTIKRAELSATTLLKPSETLPPEYVLSAVHFSRARQYVRFFSLLERAISLLHKYSAGIKEMEAFIFLSACGPLFDDLYDRNIVGTADIIRVTRSQQTIPGDDHLLEQYAVLLRNVIERIAARDEFLKSAEQLCLAQEAAARLTKEADQKEVLLQTRLRGGYTAMLCRYVMDIPLVENEQELFMQLGYLAQLTDDLFDYPVDRDQNRLTSVMSCTRLNEVVQLFELNWNMLEDLLLQLQIPVNQKKKFRTWMLLPRSVFYVGYDHYMQIDPEGLSLKQPERKVPACDMESRDKQWSLIMKLISAPV